MRCGNRSGITSPEAESFQNGRGRAAAFSWPNICPSCSKSTSIPEANCWWRGTRVAAPCPLKCRVIRKVGRWHSGSECWDQTECSPNATSGWRSKPAAPRAGKPSRSFASLGSRPNPSGTPSSTFLASRTSPDSTNACLQSNWKPPVKSMFTRSIPAASFGKTSKQLGSRKQVFGRDSMKAGPDGWKRCGCTLTTTCGLRSRMLRWGNSLSMRRRTRCCRRGGVRGARTSGCSTHSRAGSLRNTSGSPHLTKTPPCFSGCSRISSTVNHVGKERQT